MITDSFEADLREALTHRAAEVPEEAVERLQNRHYRPRTSGWMKMAGTGLAGAAAAAAVLAIAVSQPGSHQGTSQASHQDTSQASHQGGAPAGAQLAAWTVTRQADGTVSLTIRDMRDPAGLQSRLRADGVPAIVNTAGNPACQEYLQAGKTFGQVFQVHQGAGQATVIDIDTSALPSGAGVEISGEVSGFMTHLVRTSQQCTGS
jgi:hypothetical protein